MSNLSHHDNHTVVQASANDNPAGVCVPRMYIDAAQIWGGPFTQNLTLGATAPNGQTTPQVLLTTSPNFALELYRMLGKALQSYTDDTVEKVELSNRAAKEHHQGAETKSDALLTR